MSLNSFSLTTSRPTFFRRPCSGTTPARRWSSLCLAQTSAETPPASLEVELREATLVKPSTIINSGGASNCFLSNLDLFVQPITVPVVVFFAADARHGTHDPADILEAALKQVLAHYYPLAGRLALDSHGRPSIHCNAQGVPFARADANIELADLGDLNLPNPDAFSRLTYPFHLSTLDTTATASPLFTAQVTGFKCGGFALGVLLAHCVCDGTALVSFLTSWAETARGVPQLSLPPALDRTFLQARTPLQVNYSHTEYINSAKPENLISAPASADFSDFVLGSFRFAPASLAALQKRALEDGVLASCSPFEALTGLLWKARVAAMETLEAEERVKLIVYCDGRFAKGAEFPKGYFGNAITAAATTTSADDIKRNPLSHAVKLVQQAINCVTGEYIRSQIDYLEREGMQVPSLRFAASYSSTNWSRLHRKNFGIDFGLGKGIQLQLAGLPPPDASIVLAYGEGGKGMNVLWPLSPDVLKRIDELLYLHVDPLDSLNVSQ